MASCSEEYGCAEQSEPRLFLAPCGTLEYAANKPLVTATTLADGFESPEVSNFSVTPVITVSKKRKINSCGTYRCRVRKNDYNGSFNICVDPDNPTTCRMISPATNEGSCEFEFIYFPYPADCNAPNVLSDAFIVGYGIISDINWEFDPESEDCWEVPVSFEGCNRPLCRFNFCDQIEDGTEPPVGGGLTIDQQIQAKQIAEQCITDCITDAAEIKDAA